MATCTAEGRYREVHGSRMHYVDTGAGSPVLFLHGNPTSSYLWRNVIPHIARGARCIAPDLIGMGRSGKPDLEYRFEDHYRYVEAFIDSLELSEPLALVLHDWGSVLGFHYWDRHPDRVRALAFMEAVVAPVPPLDHLPQPMRETFAAFRTEGVGRRLIVEQNVFIEKFLPEMTLRELSAAEMDRYREPYTEPASRKPLWRWPNEIPFGDDPPDVAGVVADYHRRLVDSDVPKLLFHVQPGVVLPPPQVEWCRRNLENLETVDLGRGLHFIQEDHPDRIGEGIARWLNRL